MMRNRSFFPQIVAGILLFCTIVVVGGCSKKITITQYPSFYDGSIKAIAITPFRNQTSSKNAGNIVSDMLGTMLMANGTYKIYNRNDHRVLSDERDLQLDLGKAPEKVEAMFRKLGDVQAILTGVVSTYSGTSNSQRKQDPVWAYNPNTQTNYVAGYRKYVFTRNEASVVVSAALLRRDGSTIYATSAPASAQYWSQGSPPERNVQAVLAQATNNVARQLLEQFAIVRKVIKVDPSKALRIASELFENKWTFTKDFKTTDRKMYVVIKLPSSCDRNRFDIKVVRKDQRKYLIEQKITWKGEYNSYGYLFDPQKIAEAGGGKGLYTVKFFSGPEPIITQDFRIQ